MVDIRVMILTVTAGSGLLRISVTVPMSSGQFSGYLDVVDDQWTESNRLGGIAGLTYNWLTTLRVKAVITFWTESPDLNLPKQLTPGSGSTDLL